MMILSIRPDSWNFPLLLHVGGAMLLVAAMVVAGLAFVQSWRATDPEAGTALFRFGALTLFFAALPSYIVMRVAAEWILSRESLGDSNASWIGIGFATADGGGLILIISLILTGIALRRTRSGGGAGWLGRVGGALALLLLVAYVIAIWAMTTKPT
jgi:hypothetical protein